jgi:hypothetical protein
MTDAFPSLHILTHRRTLRCPNCARKAGHGDGKGCRVFYAYSPQELLARWANEEETREVLRTITRQKDARVNKNDLFWLIIAGAVLLTALGFFIIMLTLALITKGH